MASPYRSIREHLDDVLQLSLALLQRRRITKSEKVVAELDLRIVDLAELIETRLELSALRDFVLPLDRLRQAFQLEATEQRCLWLLLAIAISGEARTIASTWGRPDALSLEILDEIVYGAPELRDRFPLELGDGGRLLRYGLIEATETGVGYTRSVRIADRIVDLEYGVSAISGDVARFASLEERRAALLVPENTVARLGEALAQPGGVVPVLRGSEGSGRRSLAGNAAANLGAATLVVRCEDLPHKLGRALVAIQREAILHRAVIAHDRLHCVWFEQADAMRPAREVEIPASWLHRVEQDRVSLAGRFPALFGDGFISASRMLLA